MDTARFFNSNGIYDAGSEKYRVEKDGLDLLQSSYAY